MHKDVALARSMTHDPWPENVWNHRASNKPANQFCATNVPALETNLLAAASIPQSSFSAASRRGSQPSKSIAKMSDMSQMRFPHYLPREFPNRALGFSWLVSVGWYWMIVADSQCWSKWMRSLERCVWLYDSKLLWRLPSLPLPFEMCMLSKLRST